ncbi:phosphodiester glycosidase family protein [Brachybacterium huguangmaarense]|uniref:Phosphodiester glycosidase family protein n=1 Tax=Brachybacterium huguangmaarense TaxID=1652028 RepID=A0ABY6G3T1_9MICO|nr:phosphodiester glycosidase family protein [Brachybacterium huguangmaarense]UYG17456.1 phosphodiester glycosidase family protein [Brachybacterium huguangmaarense]
MHNEHPDTDIAPPPTDGKGPRPRSRRVTRRVLLGGGVGLLAATGGTGAWAYDRYVRDKVEVADVGVAETAAGVSTVSSTDGAYSATGYTSSTTTITLTSTATGSGSEALAWYAADIQVTDATVIRSAFANDEFGQSIIEKPSAMAAAHDAVLAINGDYYGFRDTGIEIRNGVSYRDEPARTGMAFYRDGSIRIYDETTTDADTLLAAGVWNTLSFGPAVLVDGAVPDGVEDVEIDTNIGNHSIQGKQPRTAVGVIDDNHLVFLVVDGRSEGYSAGATLPELGQILLSLGCTGGYNLDGGGSSVMIFDGDIVNQPSNGGERGTSDILYVAG